MIPILTPTEAALWDDAAREDRRPIRMLMETAGRAVAGLILQHHRTEAARGVLVATGMGNNGGDGWVVARTLHCLGVPVSVLSAPGHRSILASGAQQVAVADGVVELLPDEPFPPPGLIVDAIIGGGNAGPLRPPVRALLERLRSYRVPIIAVDGPTGLDLATGMDHGALPAARTITFGGLRRGHLLARHLVGELHVAEIGHPRFARDVPTLFDLRDAEAMAQPFGLDDHKGIRGRVLIVGGSSGMTGAARLVARAAFAAGAGIVHVATDPESATTLDTAEPDVQVHRVDLNAAPSDALLALAREADCVVVGPGLGRGEERHHLIDPLLVSARRLVLDADGVTLFGGASERLAELLRDSQTILTPHPGEFCTLFPDIPLDDRWAAAMEGANRLGQVLLLKGTPTVIGVPGGGALTTARGNPGLATGGSGDTLSGILGSIWCRYPDASHVAALAAVAHGRAADLAAPRVGVTGMRPMDVIETLPAVWHELFHVGVGVSSTLLDLPAPVAG